MSEFYCIRHVKKARAQRICDECGHFINKGEPYRYWAGKYEGEFYDGGGHEECVEWANAVMCCDDGRGSLKDSDPEDEWELAESVRDNPPSPLMRSRLPKRWLDAIDAILSETTP